MIRTKSLGIATIILFVLGSVLPQPEAGGLMFLSSSYAKGGNGGGNRGNGGSGGKSGGRERHGNGSAGGRGGANGSPAERTAQKTSPAGGQSSRSSSKASGVGSGGTKRGASGTKNTQGDTGERAKTHPSAKSMKTGAATRSGLALNRKAEIRPEKPEGKVSSVRTEARLRRNAAAPQVEKDPHQKNFHAKLAGLNSLNHNFHAYLHTQSPRFAALAAFVVTSAQYEIAQTRLAARNHDLTTAQARLGALSKQAASSHTTMRSGSTTMPAWRICRIGFLTSIRWHQPQTTRTPTMPSEMR